MQITLKNHKINLQIQYKKQKHTYFRFNKSGDLIVSSSFFMKEKDILNYILENEEKLYKMYLKHLDKLKKDQKFFYLGVEYQVIYNPKLTKVGFKDNKVYTKDDDMLSEFITQESLKVFTSEAKICSKVFNNLPDYKIKVRDMNTRWGVCNTKTKVITLNKKLLRYDLEVIDYVIIHEMCHFFIKNHSKDFWSLVENAVPNYKELRKKLK